MSVIYRSDQSVFSFASGEGYPDYISAIDDAGDWTALINMANDLPVGSRGITFDGASGTLAAGNYIALGGTATGNYELRKVASLGTYNGTGATGTIFLDAPTGFSHLDNEAIDEKVSTLNNLAGDSLVTFIPGAWESISAPDMTPEITPYYFLGTSSDRNFTVAYRGKQAFSGSVPNFILLNGFPLRFPIGRVRTVATAVSGGSSTVSQTGGTRVGQRYVTVAGASTFANGEFVEIEWSGTNPEVRQIISGGGTTTLIIDYPLQIAHANGVTVSECTASTTFTHTIISDFGLPAMSWNILMRDSSETVANDFLRRYFGGKVGRATISAEEGGMLRMSWDEVQFLGLLHNQRYHEDVGGGTTDITRYTGSLIDPTQESSDFQAVGGSRPHSGGALGEASYPTTEPYYFSQGSITYFGQTLARIRNFSIEINNNLDPRYYIANEYFNRSPYEILERRREYKMSATIAMPDSIATTATTPTLWKELLLEGVYGTAMQGFDITLTFTRGTSDTITITIPPSAAATGINANGSFILRAPHNINPDENPVQVPVEILFRDLSIVIVDSIGTYC